MVRLYHPATLACVANRFVLRSYSSSRAHLQLQARERLFSDTHGAGLVRHESIARQTNSTTQASATMAAPAADLFHTKVHEGTGTSERDPYVRTLSNQESRPPESSVMCAHAMIAPTVDECIELNKRWGSMRYWIGDSFPRLMEYLKQLQVSDAPPLSSAAESLLSKFEEVAVPKLASEETHRSKLVKLWRQTVEQTDALVQQYIFDRSAFEENLSRQCEESLREMGTLSLSSQDGILAVEALRRRTLLRRNKFIQEHLSDIIRNGSYLGFGDGLWQVFFRAVEVNKSTLLGDDTLEAIRFAWDAIMQEDVVHLPDVTAPVALFLTLVCINESKRLVEESLQLSSSNLSEGVDPSVKIQRKPPLHFLNPVVKRHFVAKAVNLLLQTPSSSTFSKALRENGLNQLSHQVALCEAMRNSQKLFEEDVAEAVSQFERKSEVKTLLSSLMGGTDAAVRNTVAHIFGVSSSTTVNWEAVMQAVDWNNNWRHLATSLLCDRGVLMAIHKLVKNAIGAKGVSRHLYTEEYADQLQLILNTHDERQASNRARMDLIVQELSSFDKVDQACGILRQLGTDMTELDQAASHIYEKDLVKRLSVTEKVLLIVLEAVAKRHPNWVKAGVIHPRIDNAQEALQNMLHIFIRLAYVPQAGAATIAQRSRRRIGPIGLQPHQFNIPVEVGFVEQYDNLQYKRYDWQGWYQRMVDVHNRNVSLRCRIRDLKRLEANGKPFADTQTERRLRILAQERVGMGVLKFDSDKYEDQSDNMTFGTIKLSEILADARKAQMGEEYWPSVEIKVRRPSGQSKAHYSLIDFDRIEKRSNELYEKYRDAKKKSLFVTPMDLWLDVKGMQVRKAAENADTDGYTVDTLENVLSDEPERS